MPPRRGIIYLALTAAMMFFIMLAFATNVFTVKNSADVGGVTRKSEAWADIWYMCSTGTYTGDKPVASCVDAADPHGTCTKQKDRVRATRAFYVITALIALVNLVVGVLDFFGALSLPFGLKPQILLISISGALIFFTLLSWAIAISWPRSKYCGASEPWSKADGFGFAASPFMMLLTMLIAIAQLVLSILLPGGASDAPEKEAA